MKMGENKVKKNSVAVIGIACRFPGARNKEEFLQNLRDGKPGTVFFSPDELKAAGISEGEISDPSFVNVGGVVEGAELFDAEFFGVSPREAELMDPQQRVFLQSAWECVEDAGYAGEISGKRVGVFAGASMSTYLIFNLMPKFMTEEVDGVTSFQAMILNDKDYIPSRVSYKLNLKGPSMAVQTACSTSLVAAHLACQSIANGECDMALAGGVSLMFPQERGHLYQEGSILSKDGYCRAFDKNATGTLMGNGVGVVLLKPLEKALEDGDHIYSVIEGSALNNDGSDKVGYTAPSISGQAEVIEKAQKAAGVTADQITYIEAHGTGTVMGDPIEMAALTQAFRSTTDKKQYCAIGSLKTMVGHMDCAAGIGGLIKASLAVKNRFIPASLHFESPNPEIDFETSPFAVNTQSREWTGLGPLRAGVSSFGVGGTNAHLILSEPPASLEKKEIERPCLFLTSAKTATAAERSTSQILSYLEKTSPKDFPAVAHTLNFGRQKFSHRQFFIGGECSTLQSEKITKAISSELNSQVVFQFPGQGSQYVGMGQELYQTETVFKEALDQCAAILDPQLGTSLIDLLYPAPEKLSEASARLMQTEFTQPVLLSVEYALSQLWKSWGVEPAAFIGHSIGEYLAAHLSGVWTLEETLKLAVHRGRLIQSLPQNGAMLSISLPESEVKALIPESLDIAAVNSSDACVVSGMRETILALQKTLSAGNISCQLLHTSHAFHSRLLEPVRESFRKVLREVRFQNPSLPFISNVTGDWITEEDATRVEYWVEHLFKAVRFSDGLETLHQSGCILLLEVGPGRTLSTLSQRGAHRGKFKAFTSLRHPQENISDYRLILESAGNLWLNGVTLSCKAVSGQTNSNRVPLPTYPFEPKRYWVDAPSARNVFVKAPQKKTVSLEHPAETSQPISGGASEEEESASGIAKQVARLWEQALGISPVPYRQEFFSLGGDSLVASRIVARLQQSFPVGIQVRHLLESQTVEKFSQTIETLLMEKIESMSEEEADKLLSNLSEEAPADGVDYK